VSGHIARFPDHFSAVAGAYAEFRPVYPPELFRWLADVAPRRRLVWDCATGTGQAARPLAEWFERVVATDASDRQIASAAPHPGVEFRVAPAESSGLEDRSVDLVTVAQALHWFDHPRFFAEVARVGAPGAALVAWCYPEVRVDSAGVQRIIDHFYAEVVGPHWPPQRRLVEEGYRSIAIPFEPVEAPGFEIRGALTMDRLVGYVGTWSATQRYRAATGHDPLPALREELQQAWGDAAEREVHWPLLLRAARLP
jgi:SAM-dependent methyltransferase